MTTFQTDAETATAEPATAVDDEESQSHPRSFVASVKGAIQRFVQWINRVDVDGQQYWS